mmetsp:Transcript_30522/g.43782  ORF Transcript_30522/g.43782 Transcript_30522/m.43782 type:complete len:235 (+) Transcript_30522:1030-1734(+)
MSLPMRVNSAASNTGSNSVVTNAPAVSVLNLSSGTYNSSLMSGFGAAVHLAPWWKYSLMSLRNGLYSKNLDRHAMGASMISLPTTINISRGIAAYNPLEALKSGVLYGCEKSPTVTSGRRTLTPSASSILAKLSSSLIAFSIKYFGKGCPACVLYISHHLLGHTALPETCHSGIVEPSTLPTITSSRGSNSLCEFTTQDKSLFEELPCNVRLVLVTLKRELIIFLSSLTVFFNG